MDIERNNSSDLGIVFTDSLSTSYTCGSGSDRFLLAGFFGAINQSDNASATYQGAAMTKLGYVNSGGGLDRSIWLFGLLGPAAGGNTIVLSAPGADAIVGFAADYANVAQSGLPDSSGSDSGTGSSLSATGLSPVSAGSWVFGLARYPSGTLSWTGASALHDAGGLGIADSDGAIATGPYTLTGSDSGVVSAIIGISFAPAAAAPAGQPTIRRWGGTPFVGGHGIGNRGPGRAWG